MSKSRKRKIPEANVTETMKRIIPNVHPQNDGFRFITIYNWIQATNYLRQTDFTNYLKNADEFSKKIAYVIGTLIPKINQQSDDIFLNYNKRSALPHCHPLKDEQIEKVKAISKSINGDDFAEQTDDSFDWWQLGITGGVRLIGLYSHSENCFYPIFCDWHHLLFPSQKYNESDYSHYRFKP